MILMPGFDGTGELFSEELPGAVVKQVEGPHLLLQSRPRECAQLIEDFLSEQETLTELTG